MAVTPPTTDNTTVSVSLTLGATNSTPTLYITTGTSPYAITVPSTTNTSASTTYTSSAVYVYGISTTTGQRVYCSSSNGGSCKIGIDGATPSTPTASTIIQGGHYFTVQDISSSAYSTPPSGPYATTVDTIQIGNTTGTYTIQSKTDACLAASPTVGIICADGSVYAGTTVGGAKMFVPPCDDGMTYSGSTCTGTRVNVAFDTNTWSNGNAIGASSTTDGYANSALFVSKNGTDGAAPFNAIMYCHNLTFGNHTDWYLPSELEIKQIVLTYNTTIPGIVSFSDTSYDHYWSSTEYTTSPQAYIWDAYPYGSSGGTTMNYDVKSGNNWAVRCARHN